MLKPVTWREVINPIAMFEGRQDPHFATRYFAQKHVEPGEIVTRRCVNGEEFYMVLPLAVWQKYRSAESDPYGEWSVTL